MPKPLLLMPQAIARLLAKATVLAQGVILLLLNTTQAVHNFGLPVLTGQAMATMLATLLH